MARSSIGSEGSPKGSIGLSMGSFKIAGSSVHSVLVACMVAVSFCYHGNAQQAPLPPGTSAPDTPPKSAQPSAATPLADAESDIALQNYTQARSLLLPWLSRPSQRCPGTLRSRLS